jgi:predicted MFS family arabinose efflux permease
VASQSEFRAGWRSLTAAALGLGSGMALYPFVINILAPHLIATMGWSKAQFAMTTAVSGLAIITYPIVGHLADRFGVRRIGGLGVLATTLSYVAIALLDGSLTAYMTIMVVQLSLGTMTTGPVFLRLVVRGFDQRRGVALAIAVSTPAIVAALASAQFAQLIEAQGWRLATGVVAAYAFVTGLLAIVFTPSDQNIQKDDRATPTSAASSIRVLFQNRHYRSLLMVTFLVSMPLVLTNSQLALVLVDNGLSAVDAGSILALFAFGTIAGRLSAGLALDRFTAEWVGAVAFSLPAIGMLIIVGPYDQLAALASAIVLIGLAFGAEGDVLAYIVSRIFDPEAYGMALGVVFATVGLSATCGAILLSQTLGYWDSYNGFLITGSLVALFGSGLLLSGGSRSKRMR